MAKVKQKRVGVRGYYQRRGGRTVYVRGYSRRNLWLKRRRTRKTARAKRRFKLFR